MKISNEIINLMEQKQMFAVDFAICHINEPRSTHVAINFYFFGFSIFSANFACIFCCPTAFASIPKKKKKKYSFGNG